MDRYDKRCLTIEEAINALGTPSHVEVNDGHLQITFLGLTKVTQEKSRGGTTISIKIPK